MSFKIQNLCLGYFLDSIRCRRLTPGRDIVHGVLVCIMVWPLTLALPKFVHLSYLRLLKVNLHRLQCIQNSAARIVTNSCKYTRITPVLRKLHGSLFSFAQSSNWLPWCTSLFILVSLNISLYIYPYTALLTILDAVRVLPISSMYQNFNLHFPSPLSSMVSVLPLMLPLFGIYILKTSVHHPLLPLLERSSKPISTQRHILRSSFSLMASPWCPPFFVPGLWICVLLLSCCALESTTQWRLSAIKVKLEIESFTYDKDILICATDYYKHFYIIVLLPFTAILQLINFSAS